MSVIPAIWSYESQYMLAILLKLLAFSIGKSVMCREGM